MAVSTPNVSIELGIHSPKKDAVVYLAAPSIAASEVAIHCPTGVNQNLTQSVVGTFRAMLAFALSSQAAYAGAIADTVISCPLGGGAGDCVLDGTPAATDLLLVIGLDAAATSKSHFIDRTVKRLLERWLEQNAAVV
jgi:hypothetical protein